jgi:hypothetical protein
VTGGIWGLITAMILQELDEQIPFLDKIDTLTGTSTGGIIALGLASGVPIADVVNIYNSSSNCSQIFNPYQPPKSDDFLNRFVEEMAKSDHGKSSIFGSSRLCVIIFAYGILKCLLGKTFRTILRNILSV